MRNLIRIAAAAVFAGTVVAMVAGPASGHQLDSTQITCATVSGTFHDFGANDHPIVWHVQVGAGASQALPATETPNAFVGAGTATAGITSLTDSLHGATATVQAYATWPGGRSATAGASVTCGAPIEVGGIVTPAPSAEASTLAPAVAPAASAVPAAARFTG